MARNNEAGHGGLAVTSEFEPKHEVAGAALISRHFSDAWVSWVWDVPSIARTTQGTMWQP